MRKDLIRVPTVGMSRQEWLSFRKNGIGGSEIGIVLGLSPYMSSLELFYRKIQATPEVDENEAMHWGKALEDVIADRWQYWDMSVPVVEQPGMMIKNYESNRIIRRCQRINAYLIHPEYSFLFASLDRVFSSSQVDISLGRKAMGRPDGVLEVKNISGWTARQWENGIPPSYVAQLQQYLLITGMDHGEIALLKDGRYMEVIPFVKSEAICQRILQEGKAFWDKVTEARSILESAGCDSVEQLSDAGKQAIHSLEPEPDGSLSYEQFLNDRYVPEALEVDGSETDYQLAEQYVAYNADMKAIEEAQRLVSNTLKTIMEKAEVLSFGNRGRVTWKQNAKGTRVFSVKLKAERE